MGAPAALLQESGYRTGRLPGPSAGAIVATLPAAGHTAKKLQGALLERNRDGRSVFASFLGTPGPFVEESVRASALRRLPAQTEMPGLPTLVAGTGPSVARAEPLTLIALHRA